MIDLEFVENGLMVTTTVPQKEPEKHVVRYPATSVVLRSVWTKDGYFDLILKRLPTS